MQKDFLRRWVLAASAATTCAVVLSACGGDAGTSPGVPAATPTALTSAVGTIATAQSAASATRVVLAQSIMTAAASSSAVAAGAIAAPRSTAVPVSLTGAANVSAIVRNGTAPRQGGLDTHGYALSADLLGSAITWAGSLFTLGAPDVADAVSSATLALPAGNYTALKLLAVGANGNQPGQTFLVTYTDGTTATFKQSIGDWWAAQNNPGETAVLTMASCVTPTGAQCSGTTLMYGYSFPLDAAKIVKNLTLPDNRNVVLLAASLTGIATPAVPSVAVSLAGAANVYALFTDGTAPTHGGLIGSGYALSATQVGASVNWSGLSFTLGAPGTADAVTSSTVPLPAGNFAALKLLAVGARGIQANQSFVVTYTDGTATTEQQSLSDWWNPQNTPGETTVLDTAYCLMPSGAKCNVATALYGYSFTLNPAKTVKSLTLPNNRDVVMLAAALTGAATATIASNSVAPGTAPPGTVTVAGDGTPSNLQLAATTYTAAASAGSVTLSVTRSGGSGGSASVSYATASGTAVAGSNFTHTSGTLTWAANDSSSRAITVAVSNSPSTTGNVNFSVNLSAPGGAATLGPNSSATVTITPVAATGAPLGNAAKVMSYLSSLNKGTSRRVLSGQHADIWTSDLNSVTQPMAVVDPLVGQTGASPAILALVLNYATDSYAYSVSVTNALANQWWSKGGMVLLSLYDNDPTFSFNTSGAPIGKAIPSSAFHSLTDRSSAAYAQWHLQLDTYAAALHTLTDSGNVVLFRPFIELNGGWNWYGAENPADFIAVWKDMHDYLMNTKGLKNVLWIYNVNAYVGGYMDYYPGANYVDVVGMDIYDYGSQIVADANVGGMYASLVATGKPLIFPEIGLAPNHGPAQFSVDDSAIINDIQAGLPNVVGFAVFNGSWSICDQNDASALMNNSWIVNLANLPGGL